MLSPPPPPPPLPPPLLLLPLLMLLRVICAHPRYALEEGGEVQLSLLFVEDEEDED